MLLPIIEAFVPRQFDAQTVYDSSNFKSMTLEIYQHVHQRNVLQTHVHEGCRQNSNDSGCEHQNVTATSCKPTHFETKYRKNIHFLRGLHDDFQSFSSHRHRECAEEVTTGTKDGGLQLVA